MKEQLKKLAAHDYGKTAFSYVERDTGREVWVGVPEQPDEVSDIDVGAIAGSPPRAAEARAQEADVPALISGGESNRVEFKQTARVNLATKQRDPVIEQMVVRSVSAFMNTDGGTLLLGVSDNGEIFGIEKDFSTLGRKQNLDGFQLWLTNLLDNALGPTAVGNAHVSFESFPDGTVCRVDVTPGKSPTFVRSGKGESDIYVRLNNSTRLLNTADAIEYVRARWP